MAEYHDLFIRDLHNEIADLQDEIERLRAAGDDLAEALRVNQGKGAASAFMSHRALTGWREARREDL